MKKALLAEIALMHSLDHPNIVKYLGHDISKPVTILYASTHRLVERNSVVHGVLY